MKILTKFEIDWMRFESAMAKKPISSYLILNSHNTLDASKNFGQSLKNDDFKTFCRTFPAMKKDLTSTNAHTSSRSTSCMIKIGINCCHSNMKSVRQYNGLCNYTKTN
eukprot:sb/3477487/